MPAGLRGQPGDMRVEPHAEGIDEEARAARPRRVAEVHPPLRTGGKALGGLSWGAGHAQGARGVSPASREHHADRGAGPARRVDHPVDHLVQRAIPAEGDDKRCAAVRRLPGEPARLAAAGGQRVVDGQAAPREEVENEGREAGRSPAPRDRVDDDERAPGYGFTMREPPITRKNSPIEPKRSIGLWRFSSPMVVDSPP